MTTATLLSGSGRWADPWHPFPETSAAIVAALTAREPEFEVTVRDDVDTALAELSSGETGGAALPDLLLVNVGLPRDGSRSPRDDAAAAGMNRFVASDRGLVVSHVSVTSFLDLPIWESAVGGTWVRGTSMHPPQGPSCVRVVTGAHAVTTGLTDFELHDERYTDLRFDPAVTVVAVHQHEGVSHPLVWLHERRGGGRTVFDALGHDAASFESATHRELLARCCQWALGR